MATEHRAKLNVTERGELFFVYRPTDDRYEPGGLLEVRRFYMVLRPQGEEKFRLIAVGKKRLPASDDVAERHWGFVDGVFQTADALRQAAAGVPSLFGPRGENLRPAGEGAYALVLHGNHTHLTYVLDLPAIQGEVQEAFNIHPEGRFVVAVKNPEAISPPGAGLEMDRRPNFPSDLLATFADRRWVPIDPPAFLDYEGAELVLIGGRDDLGEDLGLDMQAHPKDEETAEIFNDLHLEKSERTIKPLFQGVWE
jgi:hypothetical protein